MSGESLNPTPSWSAVTLQQLRMLVLLQRRDLIAIAVFGWSFIGLATYGLLLGEDMPPGAEEVFAFRMPLVLMGVAWPFGVWRHGTPAQRDHFWTLPVARGPHTLLRVGLGWVLLMGVSLPVLAVGDFVLAALATRLGEPALPHGYGPLIPASLAYLLVSALAVQVESPVRWAVIGLRVIAAAVGFTAMGDAIDVLIGSLRDALTGRFATQRWVTSYLAWLAVAVFAVAVGAFRHQES